MDQFYDGFLHERYDDFLFYAREATWKGKFMRLPRFQKHLKYNFDGLYSYNKRIADLDIADKTIEKRGKLSPTSTTHYNYTRQLLVDHYGFREILSD